MALCIFPNIIISCDTNDLLLPLVKLFDLKQPRIAEASKQGRVKITKQFSKNDMLTSTTQNYNNFGSSDTVAFLPCSKSIHGFNGTGKILFIFEEFSTLEETANSLNLTINQEVYFVDLKSHIVFEAYEINNIKINAKLGYIKKDSNLHKWDFLWEPEVITR